MIIFRGTLRLNRKRAKRLFSIRYSGSEKQGRKGEVAACLLSDLRLRKTVLRRDRWTGRAVNEISNKNAERDPSASGASRRGWTQSALLYMKDGIVSYSKMPNLLLQLAYNYWKGLLLIFAYGVRETIGCF